MERILKQKYSAIGAVVVGIFDREALEFLSRYGAADGDLSVYVDKRVANGQRLPDGINSPVRANVIAGLGREVMQSSQHKYDQVNAEQMIREGPNNLPIKFQSQYGFLVGVEILDASMGKKRGNAVLYVYDGREIVKYGIKELVGVGFNENNAAIVYGLAILANLNSAGNNELKNYSGNTNMAMALMRSKLGLERTLVLNNQLTGVYKTTLGLHIERKSKT